MTREQAVSLLEDLRRGEPGWEDGRGFDFDMAYEKAIRKLMLLTTEKLNVR